MPLAFSAGMTTSLKAAYWASMSACAAAATSAISRMVMPERGRREASR